MISAESVSVVRRGRKILGSVSFDAQPGEVTAVIGRNGAGKSTLFWLLSGVSKPEEGEVQFLGRRLGEWDSRELARRRAALPQHSSLAFPFTALEVVLLGRSAHDGGGGGSAGDLQIAYEALEKTGMSDFAERDYTTLSGGERQRVHLARVFAQIWEVPEDGARCLLLDEPISSLDIAHQHETLELACGLAHEGAAVVIILHDLNLCLQYADRVLLLDGGRRLAFGDADDVLQPEILTGAFGVPIARTGDWLRVAR